MEHLHEIFSPEFMPHGHCYFWEPEIMWVHAISDCIIAIAYFTIPVSLYIIFKKRKDFKYIWIAVLFAVFILGCGATHIMDVINIWTPYYRLDGYLRILTAIASIGTAIMLLKITPSLLLIPSSKAWKAINEELKETNLELAQKNIALNDAQDQLRIANDELKERVKEMESFSYSISHDLRSPIRSINAYSQILKEDYNEALDEGGKKHVERIIVNSLKMGRLIDDILEFTRLSRKDIHKSLTDMHAIVKTILEAHQEDLEGRKIKVDLEALPLAFADRNVIRQVWENLISNAIKYTGKNVHAAIEISSEESDQNVVFKIKDNGVGFDMAFIEKLFGVFERLHPDSEFEGTGIGLAIVQRIVQKHGGSVWAEGKLGEGATFYFSLPNQ